MKKLFQRKIEKSYLMGIGLLSIFLTVGYFSYAYFTLQTEQQNRISIKVGTLHVEMKVDDVESHQLVVNANETKDFIVTVKNTNERTARYNFYYKGILASDIEVGYIQEKEKAIPPGEKGKNLEANQMETYKIRVVNKTNNGQAILIASDVGLDYNDLELPSDGHLFKKIVLGPTATEELLEKFLNNKTYEESNVTEKKNMFIFEHGKTKQQEGWSTEERKDYRYIGSDPNNYVTFNNEEAGWRIIGVFTVEDEFGNKEKRIKMIRKEPLQTSDDKFISWDNKNISGSSESQYGSNDWHDSRLMMLLNPEHDNDTTGVTGSLYWNQGNGLCPLALFNKTIPCDFSIQGLNEEARNMIGNTKWYLGGNSTFDDVTTEMSYVRERGTTTCKTEGNCENDRKINWIGKVGLIYPSDYGYATGGGEEETKNRGVCLTEMLNNWNSYEECITNDWIYENNNYQWTITSGTMNSYYVFAVASTGSVVNQYAVSNGDVVRPTLYLKYDIKLSKGIGTQDNPFVFSE